MGVWLVSTHFHLDAISSCRALCDLLSPVVRADLFQSISRTVVGMVRQHQTTEHTSYRYVQETLATNSQRMDIFLGASSNSVPRGENEPAAWRRRNTVHSISARMLCVIALSVPRINILISSQSISHSYTRLQRSRSYSLSMSNFRTIPSTRPP